MDCDKLIRQIAIHPVLWNKKADGYCNRLITDKVWEEIGIKIKEPKEKCRKKWKYLKDEYRKALRRVQQAESGSVSETLVSRFRYYDLMSFVKDGFSSHADPLRIEGRLDSFSMDENTNMSCLSHDGTMDHKNFENVPQNCSIPTNTDCGTKRLRSDEENDGSLEIENKILKLLENNIGKEKDCDDLQFFKSLLPFVKDLPPIKKLKMRGEIHAAVLKYCENEESPKKNCYK